MGSWTLLLLLSQIDLDGDLIFSSLSSSPNIWLLINNYTFKIIERSFVQLNKFSHMPPPPPHHHDGDCTKELYPLIWQCAGPPIHPGSHLAVTSRTKWEHCFLSEDNRRKTKYEANESGVWVNSIKHIFIHSFTSTNTHELMIYNIYIIYHIYIICTFTSYHQIVFTDMQ